MDLSVPKVMGIINVTPDSFFDASRKQDLKEVLATAEKMLKDGATMLDVGGYSTRPGAAHITEEEEIKRVRPVVRALAGEFPDLIISIDTFRAAVAQVAVDTGAHIVNDISAGILDSKMLATVAACRVPYIAMHMRGTPQTMQDQTKYDNLLHEVIHYFSERLSAAREAGILDVVVDPGFGFAKTAHQNFELLHHLEQLKILERPLLVGISRKSMIYRTLEITPEQALNGTTVLNTVALLKGASILRVHDVKEAVEAVKLIKLLTP